MAESGQEADDQRVTEETHTKGPKMTTTTTDALQPLRGESLFQYYPGARTTGARIAHLKVDLGLPDVPTHRWGTVDLVVDECCIAIYIYNAGGEGIVWATLELGTPQLASVVARSLIPASGEWIADVKQLEDEYGFSVALTPFDDLDDPIRDGAALVPLIDEALSNLHQALDETEPARMVNEAGPPNPCNTPRRRALERLIGVAIEHALETWAVAVEPEEATRSAIAHLFADPTFERLSRPDDF